LPAEGGLVLAGTAGAQERGEIHREGLGFVEHNDKTVSVDRPKLPDKRGTRYLSTHKERVAVKTGNKEDEVQVEVVKKADAVTEGSASELFADCLVYIETMGRNVRVRAEAKGDEDWDDLELEFSFVVPPTHSLDLKTSGGSIEIGEGLDGWIVARTAGGSISVGAVKSGLLDVETAGGSINIGPTRVGIDAQTGRGSSSIASGRDIRAETAGGGIEAQLALAHMAAAGHCSLKTDRGDLTLYLPAELLATIDARLHSERKGGPRLPHLLRFSRRHPGRGHQVAHRQGGGQRRRQSHLPGDHQRDMFIKKGPK